MLDASPNKAGRRTQRRVFWVIIILSHKTNPVMVGIVYVYHVVFKVCHAALSYF